MVRFSCFNGHLPSHKPKKTVEPSVETKYWTSQNTSQIQTPKTSSKATSINSMFLKAFADIQISDSVKNVTSSVSIEQGWRSEEMKDKWDSCSEPGVCHTTLLKKTQSLGSELCHGGRILCDNDTDGEIDQGFSSDSVDQNGLVGPEGSKYPGPSPTSEHLKALRSESAQQGSDLVNNESVFSIGEPQHSEKEVLENSDTPLSGEGANLSGDNRPHAPSAIIKSRSLPNISPPVPGLGECSYNYLAHHSRSSEDLLVLDMMRKEVSTNEVENHVMQERERDDIVCETEKINFENYLDDGFDSYNYSASAKDWIIPVTDEVNAVKDLQAESSVVHLDEFPSKDFKIKRIEEWVNDLHHCSPLEEKEEFFNTSDPVKNNSTVFNDLNAAKIDSKVTPGMEAAKRYISSLSAAAATAQLSNHGLAAIPFLSAFVSLRVLNLSGNSIVRITAGALPRGLHILNLSKNNISTIEGLRDLARLRVLDLSYNRIFRIGHGLASCASLKELYLAGNKVSEVEGLHRLLKLTVLDLRFNKISTTKCLGQLAANYISLQAISLEGNPAQKNVGDEQLKKYLQGLLPHLVYFNRQPIKASSLKDAAERSVRLGMGAHQLDRGIRSDKAARKSSHGVGGSKPSSSALGRKNQPAISPKRTRGRLVRLPPPSGTKAMTNNRHHHFDISSKILQFRSELSIRRSQSEGTLGPF